MLISERMKEIDFSPAETNVIAYIQDHTPSLSEMTVKQIADTCYVHPSTLIRVAKKLGFNGWIELRDKYLSEYTYLHSNFDHVDANLPFADTDGIITIANKIASLEKETIQDTLSLIQHDTLNKAKQLLLSCTQIKIFASNANSLISADFALKMNRIRKETRVVNTFGETHYEAINCSPSTCAIVISYTGENTYINQTVNVLLANQVPVLAITSIGDNTLARISDVALRLTTRERLYSKIGNFTINTSVCYLLDVLYGVVFAEHYHRNLTHLIDVGEKIDHRSSSSPVMEENRNASIVNTQDSFLPN